MNIRSQLKSIVITHAYCNSRLIKRCWIYPGDYRPIIGLGDWWICKPYIAACTIKIISLIGNTVSVFGEGCSVYDPIIPIAACIIRIPH